MEITWYGHSCFRLSERGRATTIIDPYNGNKLDCNELSLDGDIVTISHDKPGHNYREAVRGDPYIINGPGEYEIGGVFITGIQTNKQLEKDETRNVLYLYEYDGLNVAHLGALDRVPSQTEVEDLGPVHVLLIPIGGDLTLDAARAAEVVSLFDPNIIIPMHYQLPTENVPNELLHKFLKQMGAEEHPQSLASLKVSNQNSLPEEARVIILEPQTGER